MKKRLELKLIVSIVCSLLQILIVPIGYGQRRGPNGSALSTTERDKTASRFPKTSSGFPFDSDRPTPPEKMLVRLSLGGQQPPAPSPAARCPQLVIACPLDIVEQDTQLRFSALVAGHDPSAALAYTWSLSGATINEGKGTPSITVETVGLGGRRITATVAVSGLARECQNIASCAIYVAKPNEARRLDAYGDLVFELEKERLASFARELKSAPDSQGYIIVYGGRCSAETQAEERAERAKDWLVTQHGIDASRIVVIDGGYRETPATEIYIGPIDATVPEPTASIQPLDKSRCR
jgi:hypothetical protein